MRKTNREQVEFENWLGRVRDLDDEIFELLDNSSINVVEKIKDSEFGETLSLMFSFLANLGFIKNGIYDTCEQDNLLSAKILFRSFLEHWLKAQYIWIRFGKEKSNEVGKEYRLFCSLDEIVKYGNSLDQLHKTLDAEHIGMDHWNLVFELKPELLNKYTRTSIKKKVKQFQYREIINFMVNQADFGNNDVLNSIIPEFSELSSYVHGGPRSIDYQAKIGSNRYTDYRGIIRFVFNMYKLVAFTTYAIISAPDDQDLLATAIAIKGVELPDN